MNTIHAAHAGDSGDNNVSNPLGFPDPLSGNDHKIRDNQLFYGFQVDNMDGPRVSPHQVASCVDGAAPFTQQMNSVFTEIIATHNQRVANYVHQGWSVSAVEAVSPWTLPRIDATNRHNEKGAWITRRTLAQRLKIQVLLEDLVPSPEFQAAIEEALRRPTTFEKFQAVYRALGRWGDVVPLEIEMGSSLALTARETDFNHFPTANVYNSLTYLSTLKTARIARNGGANSLGWEDGRWIIMDVPATEWRPIRITVVAPTLSLLTEDIQRRLNDLYDERLSYAPPLTINSIRWEHQIYDDANNASRTISEVEIHNSDYIDYVSIYYLDDVIAQGPRNSGRKHTFTLTNGEHIVEMLTCSDGEWLRGIQFITNKGRCSVIYGMLDGIPIISRSKGAILAGFSLTTKKHPEWGYVATGIRGIWRHDLIPRAPKENDAYSEYFGARTQHGNGFNDRVLIGNSSSMYISSVEVRSGASIDSIQFTYVDTRNVQHNKLKTPRHGGSGGAYHQFELGNGEHIVFVSGKFVDRDVTQLCFGTNLGRTSDIYGGVDGQSFSARAPVDKNGKSLRLQYILGKSDDTRLNGVMFAWAPDS